MKLCYLCICGIFCDAVSSSWCMVVVVQ